MRFATTIASLLTVSMAAAAVSRRSTCAAQNILDACLASTTPQLKACEANDWSCLCDQSTNVLTCYNNCPGDSDQFGAEQTKTSYCNAAKAYSTTTTSTSTATATSSSSTSSGQTSAASASASETSSSSSSTSTASWKQSTSSGAAAPAAMMTGAVHVQGGLAAVLALGLGAVL